MIKHGSMMINAVSNSTVPHISLLIGASYGAGHYGMCGRAYDPRFLFAWPSAKSAVMGGAQLAGVLSIVSRAGAEARGQTGRRGRRRRDAGGGRGADRGGVAADGAVRDAVRRRRHRPARHPHGAGNVPVRHREWPDRGDVELRRLPDVSSMITRVLVANRGEIARRVFAHVPPRSASAPSRSTPIPMPARRTSRRPMRGCGSEGRNGYLDCAQLIAAARASGADAVHPGYGFLSENADFAAAVLDAGLTWIGPPVAAVAAMGSKIEAKKMMAAAGVPVLDELDPETVTADQLPVLIKASAGGGGRGMRVVRELSELPAQVEAARREAQSAFGDPTVFCERYLAHRPPRRGPGDGRRARHRLGRRRTRMLDPAPPPEDHRRGAVAARRTHSGHARQAVRRGTAGGRAPSATPARAPSSSWPTRAATSSSSR